MQERLREKIEEEIERIIRIYAPHTEIALIDLEQTKTHILQFLRDEVKSLRVKYADYEGRAWNSALDSVLKKLEGKGCGIYSIIKSGLNSKKNPRKYLVKISKGFC